MLTLILAYSIPYFDFIQQSPSDISNTNIYNSLLNITYNATDAIGINVSTIKIYFKSNSSGSDCYIYVNGTSVCGFQQANHSLNLSDLYSFYLNARDVYPGTYNYNETLMVNTPHKSFLIDSNATYIKIRFFNVTNTKSYSIFELFANASPASGPLRIYYCNSSFAFGNPLESANCIDFYNLEADIQFNHAHPQSSHHIIPFAIDTSNGMIGGSGGVYVTPTSYFLLRGRDASDWRAFYITNISRQDSIQNLTVKETTLRPNAAGSAANLVRTCTTSSACTANWHAVDDIVPDGDTTRLHSTSTTVITYDMYNIPDLTVSSSLIKKVIVYIVARATSQCAGLCQSRTELRTNGADYHGTAITLSGTAYTTYSTEYALNPGTGQPWTVSEINAMQIGVGLKSRLNQNNRRARATQVYAVVEYTDWANFSGTVDASLHQYDGSDTFHYYICASDTTGVSNCSAVRSDLLDLTILPPTSPEVYEPVADFYSGIITINYTQSNSPNGYLISYYNISLVHPNTTFVQAILPNNSVNLSYVWNSSQSADGNYRISVEACDNQSQCSSGRSQIFTIDHTNPTINFTPPTEISDDNISRNYIYANVTSTDTNFGRIRIFLYNATDFLRVTSEFTSPFFWNFTDLSDGTYFFNSTALDLANNSNSTETRNVTIDTTGPSVQFVSPTTSAGAHIQTWIYANVTAVDAIIGLKNITIYLYNLTGDLVNSTNTTNSLLQINFTNLPYNTYFINATAVDNLNNIDSTDTIAIVLSAVPDTIPPDSVTSLSSSVTSTTANWQWTNPIDVDFYTAILYLDGDNLLNTTENSYNFTALTCNTQYNLTVHTKDFSGNVNMTDVTNITTTSSCPDTAPPASVTGLSSSVTSTTVKWQWTNPADADFASAILYLDGTNVADTANENYNATGFTCNTEYNMTVHTRDELWNVNTTDVTDIATTSACPGTTTTASSSGGGGGGGRGGEAGAYLTETLTEKGLTFTISLGYAQLFKFNNKQHSVTVKKIEADNVTLIFRSDEFEAVVTLGSTVKIDIEQDDDSSEEVTVLKIEGSKVTLFIKPLGKKSQLADPVNAPSEQLPAEVIPPDDGIPTAQEFRMEGASGKFDWKKHLINGILVLVMVIIFLAIQKKKSKIKA